MIHSDPLTRLYPVGLVVADIVFGTALYEAGITGAAVLMWLAAVAACLGLITTSGSIGSNVGGQAAPDNR
ncbi:hypothetical protein SAMN05216226_102148 [Halovenus aranensis]|uniref:Uncharacterized protein n=1 Tax=Halovenus aranensis TaxID=890420 RepID=A0A1G8SU81_9EURY|nr:hypothetical protein [Halovenus aranensis]SDJ32798.1 hypothetical protein SAMN05216226_102148 [Halovenus aranensis]